MIELVKANPRPRLTDDEYKLIQDYREKNRSAVLVIGDLHAPFIKEGYLEFCIGIKNKYGCNQIVFIGDVIDSHYASFHETDPDGMSAKEELELSIEMINKWYKAFPIAKVCLGNHDRIPDRKRFSAGLSEKWIRTIAEVLEVPNWDFQVEHEIDGVLYIHGLKRKVKTRSRDELVSIVQGHWHSESDIYNHVGLNTKIFGMQVGCGIDRRSFAMAYSEHSKKQHINVGIVIDGKLPILEYMELG